MLTAYKILSFIIMPISYIVLLCIVLFLPSAFANPQLLLGVVFMICLFLYSFFSFRFNVRAVIGNNPVKKNLKDLIKINSYVAFFQMIMVLVSIIVIYTNQSAVASQIRIMYNQMDAMANSNGISFEQFYATLLSSLKICLVFCIIYIVHIILTWRLLRAYSEYFSL